MKNLKACGKVVKCTLDSSSTRKNLLLISYGLGNEISCAITNGRDFFRVVSMQV
jgi:hypothetical protein